MGPYCIYCNNRCFLPFPENTPKEVLASYGENISIIATCKQGQEAELQRVGWNYKKIGEYIQVHGPNMYKWKDEAGEYLNWVEENKRRWEQHGEIWGGWYGKKVW